MKRIKWEKSMSELRTKKPRVMKSQVRIAELMATVQAQQLELERCYSTANRLARELDATEIALVKAQQSIAAAEQRIKIGEWWQLEASARARDIAQLRFIPPRLDAANTEQANTKASQPC